MNQTYNYNDPIFEFANTLDVSIDDLLRKDKLRKMSDIRHLYWYYLNEKWKYSYTEIGLMNNRNRTAVYHGIVKISGYLASGDKWACEMWEKVKCI